MRSRARRARRFPPHRPVPSGARPFLPRRPVPRQARRLGPRLPVARLACLLAPLLLLAECADYRDRANPFDPGNPDTGGEPALLRAVAGDGQVLLEWELEGFDPVRATRILRRTLPADSETVLASFDGAGAGSFLDIGLPNRTAFVYRLEIDPEDGPSLSTAGAEATPGGSEPWVADGSGGGVARLSPDGRHVLFRVDPFRSVLDMEFEADGSFWAADYGNGEVVRYASSGARLLGWDEPSANTVAVDRESGNLWVGSFLRQRLTAFTRLGAPLFSDSTHGYIEEIEAAPGGGVWVASRNAGVSFVQGPGQVLRFDDFEWPSQIEVADNGDAWVLDRQQDTVFRISGGAVVVEPVTAALVNPVSIESDEAGGLFVADPDRGGVVHIDASREEIAFFPLGRPDGVTWDPAAGALWLSYSGEGRVDLVRIARIGTDETAVVVASLGIGGRPVGIDGRWRH